MFQPGAIFFISAILTPEIEFIIETLTWSYLELWKAMTVQSIISQNPFLLPLLPSSPGHKKKSSIWGNNINKLFLGQKSPIFHSILIKTTDTVCQRGTGDAAQQGWTRCLVSGMSLFAFCLALAGSGHCSWELLISLTLIVWSLGYSFKLLEKHQFSKALLRGPFKTCIVCGVWLSVLSTNHSSPCHPPAYSININ